MQITGMEREANYLDIFPHYGVDCLAWSCVFIALYSFMPMIVQSISPTMFAGETFLHPIPPLIYLFSSGLTPKKKIDFNSYVCSLVHHIIVVPIAFYRLMTLNSMTVPFSLFSRYNLQNITPDTSQLFHCDAAPFSFGYLFSDTLLYALPEALYRKNREYLYHHSLGLCLFLAVPYLSPDLSPYCGRILIMESTSIFFTTAYLLRNYGFSSSPLVPLLEFCFALDFFLVRVVNGFDLYVHILSDLTFVKHENPAKAALGYGLAILFVPILAMQVYWMIVIIKKSVTRYDTRNNGGGLEKKEE
jgi:hypothetical protein